MNTTLQNVSSLRHSQKPINIVNIYRRVTLILYEYVYNIGIDSLLLDFMHRSILIISKRILLNKKQKS